MKVQTAEMIKAVKLFGVLLQNKREEDYYLSKNEFN